MYLRYVLTHPKPPDLTVGTGFRFAEQVLPGGDSIYYPFQLFSDILMRLI